MQVEIEWEGQLRTVDLSKPMPVLTINNRTRRRHKNLNTPRNKRRRKVIGPVRNGIQSLCDDKDLLDTLEARKMPKDWEQRVNDERVEYDLEEEDFVWLDLLGRKLGLDESTLEFAIDQLEKKAIFYTEDGTEPLIDEDAICAVCLDDECNNSNAILFCDRCNIPVHQDCYGVPFIPTGEWICQRCLYSPSRRQQCELCPSSDGALKQTVDSKWVHILCVLWTPELYFLNPVYMEPACSISELSADRLRLRCSICSHTGGACIQCSGYHCFTAFHVTCAQSNGYFMRLQPEGPSEIYCPSHIPNHCLPESVTAAEYIEQRMRRYRELVGKMSGGCKEYRMDPTVSSEDLETIRRKVQHKLKDDNSFTRIYNYWKLKRYYRNGVPLVRRLQCEARRSRKALPEEPQYSPALTAIKLRQSMETVRQLCELTLKRERIRLALNNASKEEYLTKRSVVAKLVRSALRQLLLVDRDKVFHRPVTEDIAPGYHAVIARPICLNDMKSKQKLYSSLDQLVKDFELMCTNCLVYNSEDSSIFAYAVQYRNEGRHLLEKLVSRSQCPSPRKVQRRRRFPFQSRLFARHRVKPCETTIKKRKRRKWRREYVPPKRHRSKK